MISDVTKAEFDFVAHISSLECKIGLSMCAYDVLRMYFVKKVPASVIATSRLNDKHAKGLCLCSLLDKSFDVSVFLTNDSRWSMLPRLAQSYLETLRVSNVPFNVYPWRVSS